MMVEETEKSILNPIRSTEEFNHSLNHDLAPLFHTSDPITGIGKDNRLLASITYVLDYDGSHKKNQFAILMMSPLPLHHLIRVHLVSCSDRHTYIIESHYPEHPKDFN